MENLCDFSDEKILDMYDDIRGQMSYYNAAEGNWSKETQARNATRARMYEISAELDKRGLEGRPGEYLC